MIAISSQRGAFLIIAMILLIVLSGLGLSVMSMAVTNNKVIRNYGNYLEARMQTKAMIPYIQNKISTLPSNPIPAACDTVSRTCLIVKQSALPDSVFRSAMPIQWWKDNAQPYGTELSEDANQFYLVVEQSRYYSDDLDMHEVIYRVITHSTDVNGITVATLEDYAKWQGYDAPQTNTFNYRDPLPEWIDLKTENGKVVTKQSGWGSGWGVERDSSDSSWQDLRWPAFKAEIMFNPKLGKSQSLTFDSAVALSKVDFKVQAFSRGEGEQGVYELLDQDGNVIEGTRTIFQSSSVQVEPDVEFYGIKFSATYYDPRNHYVEDNGYDSSDYVISEVKMETWEQDGPEAEPLTDEELEAAAEEAADAVQDAVQDAVDVIQDIL